MAIKLWRPLRVREAAKPITASPGTAPYVSEALEKKLRTWIEDCVETSLSHDELDRIAVRLDIDAEAFEDRAYFYDDTYIHVDDLYDVIDAILDFAYSVDRDSIQQLLDDSLSKYTVAPDGLGLVNRADPVSTAALNDGREQASVRTDAGSASDHLATAWGAAFARQPDTVKSYSESVKAVEAAAHAIIEPNNGRATLGTMLGHMRSHPDDFCLMLPAPGVSVTAATAMMTALWEGQTSRHAGQTPTRPVPTEEARAAVHLAVVLVQWFSTGVVRRKA